MYTLKDLNSKQTWNFDNQSQVSEFISTMSFGFEWQLLDNNNQVIATHFYE